MVHFRSPQLGAPHALPRWGPVAPSWPYVRRDPICRCLGSGLRSDPRHVSQGRLLRIPLWQPLSRGPAGDGVLCVSIGGGVLCISIGHLVPLRASVSRHPADGDLIACGRKSCLNLNGSNAEALPRAPGVIPDPRDGRCRVHKNGIAATAGGMECVVKDS